MCIFKVEIGDLLVKIDVKRMAATNQITKIIQDYIYIIYKYIQIYSLVPWPPLLENSWVRDFCKGDLPGDRWPDETIIQTQKCDGHPKWNT